MNEESVQAIDCPVNMKNQQEDYDINSVGLDPQHLNSATLMSIASSLSPANTSPDRTESSSCMLEFGSSSANDACHHDPLLGCTSESCDVCGGNRSDDEGEDSDGELATARILAGDTAQIYVPRLDGNLSDSDSSISSFTNLYSACSDVVEEMKTEEVRWFYKYDNDKKWTPFLGYDSIRIENRHRESKKLTAAGEHDPVSNGESEPDKIYVRGGLYEVDIDARKCVSTYWNGEQFLIQRGTWFHDGTWQPLDEQSAEQIEEAHMKKFGGLKCSDFVQITPSKGPKPVVLNLQLTNFHVDWNNPREVFLFSEATSHKIMRSFILRFGFQKSGYRLHRGYSEEATLDDKPKDITHLVFVIHGIGQKGETDKIIRNCSKMRDCATYLKKKYFPLLQTSSERSEFFPVEWRSSLRLDGDTVESVTPHKIRGLRELLNRTAMDIMYYTSPLYRSEIVHCLTNELNRLYQLFCQRNPSFESADGKVSVVAHSLGCVIMYDILTNFNPVQLYFKDFMNDMGKDMIASCQSFHGQENSYQHDLESKSSISSGTEAVPKKSSLKFKVENFFCLGSPMAVFLALRGIRPNEGSMKTVVPSSVLKRLFNIYHPSDPVAYRLEPLILKSYAAYAPLQIHYYASIEKLCYENMLLEPLVPSREDTKEKLCCKEGEELRSPEKVPKVGAESRWSLMWTGWRKRGSPSPLEQELHTVMMTQVKEKVVSDIDSPDNMSDCDQALEKYPELEFRLDYVLREGNLDSSGYLAAFTAHTSYWTSYDVAYFLLTYLHPGMDS